MHARLYIGLTQNSVDVLFNEVRLAFFDNQQATFAAAERFELLVHQGVGDIQDVKGNLRLAKSVGQA